jgi:hypothetical protein
MDELGDPDRPQSRGENSNPSGLHDPVDARSKWSKIMGRGGNLYFNFVEFAI